MLPPFVLWSRVVQVAAGQSIAPRTAAQPLDRAIVSSQTLEDLRKSLPQTIVAVDETCYGNLVASDRQNASGQTIAETRISVVQSPMWARQTSLGASHPSREYRNHQVRSCVLLHLAFTFGKLLCSYKSPMHVAVVPHAALR